MTQFPADIHPDLLARFSNNGGALPVKMGIEYDILGRGHFVVVCRRAFIVAGDYACTATKS